MSWSWAVMAMRVLPEGESGVGAPFRPEEREPAALGEGAMTSSPNCSKKESAVGVGGNK